MKKDKLERTNKLGKEFKTWMWENIRSYLYNHSPWAAHTSSTPANARAHVAHRSLRDAIDYLVER